MIELMERVFAVCADPNEKLETRWAALHGLRAMRWKENVQKKRREHEIRRIARRRKEEKEWKSQLKSSAKSAMKSKI